MVSDTIPAKRFQGHETPQGFHRNPINSVAAGAYDGFMKSEPPMGPAPTGPKEHLWSLLMRTRLFVTSYAPLAFILAAQNIESVPAAGLWAGVGLWGMVDAWLITHGATRRAGRTTTVEDVQDRGEAAAGYLTSYLLPLVGTTAASYEDVLGYVIYGLVLWTVYVRSSLAVINPTIYLWGWRVAEVRHAGRKMLLVCHDLPTDGDRITVAQYLDVLFEKRTR